MYSLFRIDERRPRPISACDVHDTDVLCLAATVMQARALFVRAGKGMLSPVTLVSAGVYDGFRAFDARQLDPMRFRYALALGAKLRLLRYLRPGVGPGSVGLVIEILMVGTPTGRALGGTVLFESGHTEVCGPDELDVLFETTGEICPVLALQEDFSAGAIAGLLRDKRLSFHMSLQ